MAETISQRFDANAETIRAILEASGARLAYLFGSVANGKERLDSDLDVAVLFSNEIPKERYGEIQVRLLTELVGLTHTNDVDLVILNDAPPLLSFQVVDT